MKKLVIILLSTPLWCMKPESPQKEKPTQQQVIDAIIFLADLTEKKLSPRPYGSLDIFPTEENTYTQLRP